MKRPKLRVSRNGTVFISLFILCIVLTCISFKNGPSSSAEPQIIKKDSIVSVNAFMGVYAVLESARCMNCHPSGDIPLQGDDSHLHTMGVKRGLDGKGVYAMKCANCHQSTNLIGLHMPPGNPKWGLPPANMKMIFQGRTPHELALQLIDLKQNGGKTGQQLINHVTYDSLVLAGWHPANGLKFPPMSHQKFAALFKKWIITGAYAPNK